MKKVVFIILLILIILLAGFWIYLKAKETTPPVDIGSQPSQLGQIRVDEPQVNDFIINPLTIRGQAQGSWFFEGSFSIRLLDENGKELGTTIAQAQADWMTEDLVPFAAELVFTPSSTKSGFLILQKDNPSGLPQNADQVRIPVKF